MIRNWVPELAGKKERTEVQRRRKEKTTPAQTIKGMKEKICRLDTSKPCGKTGTNATDCKVYPILSYFKHSEFMMKRKAGGGDNGKGTF